MIFWILVILGLVTATQLMRVSLLARKLSGKNEEDISDAENNMNAIFLGIFALLMLGSVAYMIYKYGTGLIGEAASEHGESIDFLFNINWIIVLFVFFVTNFVLFYFSVKYRGKKGRTAYYFPHDNRLEMIWTIIPASALAVIIILGLNTWNDITSKPSDNAKVVEVFGEQFSWTVRYAGEDNKLGYADYKLTTGSNPLGVMTVESMEDAISEMQATVDKLKAKLEASEKGEAVYSVADEMEMELRMEKFARIKERIVNMQKRANPEKLLVANDDYMTKMELHLVKGQEYQFIFRSKDVMHSAYFPHFRAQMNVVPGMRTKFKFKPTISTAEMRNKRGDDNFNYALLCNKICGEGHSNMKMIVVVDDSEEEFMAWKKENTKAPIAKN
ncbi:MAG: cytochrome c oxidase subunit II transmembrane domain-containing protein [Putridiphycobacter sp.]